jgi:hypothetical protein
MSQDAITAVKLRCNVTCDLLQQYDGFFARLSLSRKDVTPNTIAEAHRFISKNANILVHQLKMSVIQRDTLHWYIYALLCNMLYQWSCY